MTRSLRPAMFALLLLAACQTPGTDGVTPATPQGLATAAIETTKLDAAPSSANAAAKSATVAVAAPDVVTVQVPDNTTPRPKARPAAVEPAAKVIKPQQTAAPVVPEVPKLPEQLACEKSRGTWATVGQSGPGFCQRRTRDGGKQCSLKTQCEGECLARSGTCSPITPLFGCNEVLDKDGRMMTNCLQ